MHHEPLPHHLERLLPHDLRDDVVATVVDDEIVLLDQMGDQVIRLDSHAVARLRTNRAARGEVLDALGQLGLRATGQHRTTEQHRGMSRRQLIAAGAAVSTPGPSLSVIATIAVGTTPIMLAVSPDGTRVFVANYDAGTVSVINAVDNTTYTTIAGFAGPWCPTISPDGTRLYITNNYSTPTHTVTVLETTNLTSLGTLTVGPSPTAAVTSLDGSKLYVVNNGTSTGGNSVSVVNPSTNTARTIPVGSRPYGAVLAPDGSRLYVTNYDSGLGNTMSVIDTSTD